MNASVAAKLAVENVLKEGLTDIFPNPLELDLLNGREFRRSVADKVAKCLAGRDLDALAVGPIEHVLLPKGGPFDFRRCALIQPLDTIKYIALVLTVADEVERCRPKVASHVVFSYRLRPSKGYLFNEKQNITSFRQYVSLRSRRKSTKYVVACDIANFYDRVNIHRLESILVSLSSDKSRVRQINQLLLFWANRDSYGLPVGSNASRILAEAALLEVDRYMLSIGAKFCRFVDDYRFFAPDAQSAHHWLTQLIERLWLEGLTINMAKTRIESASGLGGRSETKTPGPVEQIRGARARPSRKGTSERASKKGPSQRPQFRIVAGYGGLVPTRFRAPHRADLREFRGADCKEKLKALRDKQLPAPEDVTDFVKSILATKSFSFLTSLPEVTALFPQFTPYVVEVLVKYSEKMTEAERKEVGRSFSNRLIKNPSLPEYISISLVRLLGARGFEDKNTLLRFFRNLRRNAGAYIGRALLDSLEAQVTRGEVLEIRRYFPRADQWEKRQIVRIVDRHLHEEEKRPWLKNIRIQEANDLFLIGLATAGKN
jgi:hypothetical protein